MPQCALDRLRDEIIRLASPNRILLFSHKQYPDGGLSAVKLCVVIGEGDPLAVERELYVHIDADLPYDLLVYGQADWDRLLHSQNSFARRIQQTGSVLYAKE